MWNVQKAADFVQAVYKHSDASSESEVMSMLQVEFDALMEDKKKTRINKTQATTDAIFSCKQWWSESSLDVTPATIACYRRSTLYFKALKKIPRKQ